MSDTKDAAQADPSRAWHRPRLAEGQPCPTGIGPRGLSLEAVGTRHVRNCLGPLREAYETARMIAITQATMISIAPAKAASVAPARNGRLSSGNSGA
ncbi:hypothetical protein BH18ACT12_BH18ACT12_14640 [soil metagenome]